MLLKDGLDSKITHFDLLNHHLYNHLLQKQNFFTLLLLLNDNASSIELKW